MLFALVAVVHLNLAASPDGLKLAFPGLTGVGVSQEKLAYFTDHLDQHLTFAGADTVTSREIAALLGAERQRQLLGCSEDSNSCMAELAGALNADAMVIGDVTRIDDVLTINLKLMRPDSSTLAAYSDRASTESAVIESLATGARALVSDAAAALGRKVTPKAVTRVSTLRKLSVAPALIGLAGVATGAYFLVRARLAFDALAPGAPISASQASMYVTDGERSQLLGWILTGVGVAAFAGAAGMFFAGRDQTISTSIAPVPGGGAAMSVWGTW